MFKSITIDNNQIKSVYEGVKEIIIKIYILYINNSIMFSATVQYIITYFMVFIKSKYIN